MTPTEAAPDSRASEPVEEYSPEARESVLTPERRRALALSLVVLLACSLGWLRTYYPATLESWDWIWYDRIAHKQPSDADVESYAVILVDDESLAHLEESWPLSRATWAHLLRKVAAAKPRVIAMPVWFEKPVRQPALDMTEELLVQLEELEASHPLPDVTAILDSATRGLAVHDANKQLANAVAAAGNVILGMACINRATALDQPPLPDWMSQSGAAASSLPALSFPCNELSVTFSELSILAASNAGINIAIEADGITRRYPLHFTYRDAVYPSLASAVLSAAGDGDASTIRAQKTLRDDGGLPLIRPFSTARIHTISLIDALDASGADTLTTLLADKKVFIGVSALGAGGTVDYPGYARVPDVFSHVIAAVNVQRGTLVSAYGPHLEWSVVISILALIALAWLSRHLSLGPTLLVSATCLALSLIVSNWMLERGSLITLVPWWFGVAGIAVVSLGSRLYTDRRNREEARRIRGAFQHYVAPEIIDELMSNRAMLRLGGERKVITALFADIAGFTRIAEDMEPSLLVQLLNELLTAISDALVSVGGTIDKYVGDATVAMFGAPVAHPDHAQRACRAALACQARLAEVRARWRARELPDIHVRIGINSGLAVVGNVGSETRFDYTMLGDTVNLAARLEGVNNVYRTDILVGEETYAQAGESMVFREVDRVRVKGKHRAVSIYEPIGMVDEVPEAVHTVIADYEAALAKYRARDFDAAMPLFTELAERGDGPSRTMRRRTEKLLSSPPPPDWDATFDLTHK